MNSRFTSGNIRSDLPKDVEQSRIVPFVLSTYNKDRNNTVLNQEKWKLDEFRKNPIVRYMHSDGATPFTSPDPDYVIGQGVATMIEGTGRSAGLVDKLKFDPAGVNTLAETIFRKVLLGTMRAASVMFLEIGKGKWGSGEEAKGRSNETYYTAGQELLEWSIVNIPSNPYALKRLNQSVGDRSIPAIMYFLSELGKNYNRRQIEQMKVQDLLNILGAKDLGINTKDPDKARKIISDPVAIGEMNKRILQEQNELRERMNDSEMIILREIEREQRLKSFN
ncbi:MAG TPA: hypothetical protein VK213_13545 [Bacteroidales bacterium]|nr:hypothetical protein [Bacteroidales bacterium]